MRLNDEGRVLEIFSDGSESGESEDEKPNRNIKSIQKPLFSRNRSKFRSSKTQAQGSRAIEEVSSKMKEIGKSEDIKEKLKSFYSNKIGCLYTVFAIGSICGLILTTQISHYFEDRVQTT
jgi:hypothetical protein